MAGLLAAARLLLLLLASSSSSSTALQFSHFPPVTRVEHESRAEQAAVLVALVGNALQSAAPASAPRRQRLTASRSPVSRERVAAPARPTAAPTRARDRPAVEPRSRVRGWTKPSKHRAEQNEITRSRIPLKRRQPVDKEIENLIEESTKTTTEKPKLTIRLGGRSRLRARKLPTLENSTNVKKPAQVQSEPHRGSKIRIKVPRRNSKLAKKAELDDPLDKAGDPIEIQNIHKKGRSQQRGGAESKAESGGALIKLETQQTAYRETEVETGKAETRRVNILPRPARTRSSDPISELNIASQARRTLGRFSDLKRARIPEINPDLQEENIIIEGDSKVTHMKRTRARARSSPAAGEQTQRKNNIHRNTIAAIESEIIKLDQEINSLQVTKMELPESEATTLDQPYITETEYVRNIFQTTTQPSTTTVAPTSPTSPRVPSSSSGPPPVPTVPASQVQAVLQQALLTWRQDPFRLHPSLLPGRPTFDIDFSKNPARHHQPTTSRRNPPTTNRPVATHQTTTRPSVRQLTTTSIWPATLTTTALPARRRQPALSQPVRKQKNKDETQQNSRARKTVGLNILRQRNRISGSELNRISEENVVRDKIFLPERSEEHVANKEEPESVATNGGEKLTLEELTWVPALVKKYQQLRN